MTVKELTSFSEFQATINSGKAVLIDFYADWCGPCKSISPYFHQHSDTNASTEGIEFYKVDVDKLPDVAQECKIRAMPTFQLYKNGERVADMLGAKPTELTALVQNGLALA
ncbi:thioredoxin [Boletus edulis]|uniref:Thioredoxin n=1 Tax=Boletus edulis BED1 TaxID=1328754 RepID=A0AAD4BPA9_BOLED|nr:thioredoxin [Boletus edulis]KAF8435696.1 thioredoxin [Boletus edulis BED1]